jgi:hypothetical protein
LCSAAGSVALDSILDGMWLVHEYVLRRLFHIEDSLMSTPREVSSSEIFPITAELFRE